MSTLSDVQALYGSVRDTWTKSQPHILTHVVAGVVVFGICRVSWPEFHLPQVDPQQVMENNWFKLAKDTGLVYVSLVLPVIAVAMYGELLRISGRVLTTLMTMIFQPSAGLKRPDLLSVGALESLALTLRKKDFDLSDLHQRAGEVAWKFQSNKVEAWTTIQKSIAEPTKDSLVYLGDFLTFSAVWVLLFRILSSAAWTQANRNSFWPVLLIFLALAWFAWFRVSRAMAVLPILYLMSVSGMLASDPDTSPLREASDEEREQVRERLEEILRQEREKRRSRPSLGGFFRYRLGMVPRRPVRKRPSEASLYRFGQDFGWDAERHGRYDDQWWLGYLAYLYYRLSSWLSTILQTVWQLIRYLVTGAP